MTFTTCGFSWSSVPKKVSIETERGVKNVKIPFGGNGFQTWCHAAVMFFFLSLHTKTQADHKREWPVLSVWVSAFVFHFHCKHLHAWKINQWHLHHKSWVNASLMICHLPVTQTGVYSLCGPLMIIIIIANDMNGSPTSQNQNNHQRFLSIINRTIRTCWQSCWAEFSELRNMSRSEKKISRETFALLWTPFKAATLDTVTVGTAEGAVRKTWECTISSITLSNPAHHQREKKNSVRVIVRGATSLQKAPKSVARVFVLVAVSWSRHNGQTVFLAAVASGESASHEVETVPIYSRTEVFQFRLQNLQFCIRSRW